LGLTQSAVSHGPDKLRAIVGDRLFVKSGRGIVATTQADALAVRARALLDELRAFASSAAFEPASLRATVTLAANDLQRDLLLPDFLRAVRVQAPGVVLRVIPSGVPGAEMLRDQHCDLAITPRPPAAADIVHKRLFEDEYRVFYDDRHRRAPRTVSEYVAAEHVTVLFEPSRQLDIDEVMAARGIDRRFVAMVPNFAGIGPFLRGSDALATLPGLLRANLLRGFAHAPVPLPCPVMPMYLVWHVRRHADPAHRWLRRELERVVAPSLSTVGKLSSL
jgi:DNA-binding transcriptional LysR family regulator